MFSWPAVVRSCLLHHTYASIYVDKYSLSSIRIILTIFHELATINIYVPAHSRGKKNPHADTDGALQHIYSFLFQPKSKMLCKTHVIFLRSPPMAKRLSTTTRKRTTQQSKK